MPCSPSHFFRLGIAHLFLLGLVKDFWRLWLRPIGKAGDFPVLPAEIRAQISRNGDNVQTTELFGKPYTDLLKCAHCGLLLSLRLCLMPLLQTAV